MKIVLLGATGFVGAALLTEAIDREHTVRAIARQPEKIAPHERLIVEAGDVYDAMAHIRPAFHGRILSGDTGIELRLSQNRNGWHTRKGQGT